MISAVLEQFDVAIDIYEKICYFSAGCKGLKWNLKEQLLSLVLCRLCVHVSMEKQPKSLPCFQDTCLQVADQTPCRMRQR